MNKIEPNMYVRTLFGIKKIDHIDNKKTVWKYLYKINDDNEFYALSDNDVIKASYNIIDLIEEGDYVNGSEVREIHSFNGMNFVDTYEVQPYGWNTDIPEENIKSIVTKEQMEAIQYVVK